MSPAERLDRGAAIRQALLEMVAEQGLHGTSMGALARRAGVAAGTIYVHYADKNALILAVYAEVKGDLGTAAATGWDPTAPPERRFLDAWHRVHAHLVERPERARFLLQLEVSPYATAARQIEDQVADIWSEMTAGMRDVLVELPDHILYELAFGPALSLAASAAQNPVDETTLNALARACWRAVTH